MDAAQTLEKLKGLETHVKELQDHIKKLEANLPAIVHTAIVEGLHNPETLEFVKKLVT